MDSLLKALDSGELPKDWLQNLDRIPAKREQRLKLFYEKVEMLLYNLFLGSNDDLFYSFMEILWNCSDLDQYELRSIRGNKEDKTRFASILSSVKDYYFNKEGIRVLLSNSNSNISYTYIICESVLHVHYLGEDYEEGVILLSEDTSKELTLLNKRVMEWVGGKPLFADGEDEIYLVR